MALDDAYQAGTDALARDMIDRPQPVKPAPAKFSIWRTTTAVPRGAAAGAAESAGLMTDIGGAVTGAFGQVLAATDARNSMFSMETATQRVQNAEAAAKMRAGDANFNLDAGDSFRNVSRGYRPDPVTAHAAESLVFDASRIITKAVGYSVAAGPIAGAGLTGIDEGMQVSDDLKAAGVDLTTRTQVATVQGLGTAVGVALPVVGKTVLGTAGLVVAGGPATFIAQQSASREILQRADYSKIADQYDPLDPVGLAVSTLVPAAFGAYALRGARRAGTPTPSEPAVVAPSRDEVDAARVALQAEDHRAGSLAEPTDIIGQTKHDDAVALAEQQLARGEPVKVDTVLDNPRADAVLQDFQQTIRDEIPMAENLTPDQRAIEQQLADKVTNDFDAVVAEYSTLKDSMGGKVLNTDVARELSPGYLADRTQSAAVHEPASWFIKKLYAEKLAALPPNDVVVFSSGGTGAGKTTALNSLAAAKTVVDGAGLVYDTNMNTLPSASKKIDQALAAGHQVQIFHVQRDPVDSLVNGALKRAMSQIKEFGTGRTVPLVEHAKTHRGSAQVIQQLAEKYKDDPRVDIQIIDNTRGQGNAAFSDLGFIRGFDYNGLEGKLSEALKQQYDAGTISEAVYRGTQGDAGAGVGTAVRSDIGAGPQRVDAGAGQPAASGTGTPAPRSVNLTLGKDGRIARSSDQPGQVNPDHAAYQQAIASGDQAAALEALTRIRAGEGRTVSAEDQAIVALQTAPQSADAGNAALGLPPGTLEALADTPLGQALAAPAPKADASPNVMANAVAKLNPDMQVMLDGMDAPMRLSDFLEQVKRETDADIADAPLYQLAAECAIVNGT